MASNIYTRNTITGPVKHQRKGTQGRKPKDKELLMKRKNITMSGPGMDVIKRKAKMLNLSFSAYLELAGVLYTPESVKS